MHGVPRGIVAFLALIFGFGIAVADVPRPKVISGLGVASSLNLREVSVKKVDLTALGRPKTSIPARYSISNLTGKAIPISRL